MLLTSLDFTSYTIESIGSDFGNNREHASVKIAVIQERARDVLHPVPPHRNHAHPRRKKSVRIFVVQIFGAGMTDFRIILSTRQSLVEEKPSATLKFVMGTSGGVDSTVAAATPRAQSSLDKICIAMFVTTDCVRKGNRNNSSLPTGKGLHIKVIGRTIYAALTALSEPKSKRKAYGKSASRSRLRGAQDHRCEVLGVRHHLP